MAASSSQDQDSMITDINITPMVDVMLVLLVIFMIAAPSLYQGSIKIDLPSAKSGAATEKITLSFSLQKDGRIFLDKREVQKSEVNTLIKNALQIDPKADALIAADRALTHGAVMEFVDQLKLNGIQRFAVAVEGPQPSSK